MWSSTCDCEHTLFGAWMHDGYKQTINQFISNLLESQTSVFQDINFLMTETDRKGEMWLMLQTPSKINLQTSWMKDSMQNGVQNLTPTFRTVCQRKMLTPEEVKVVDDGSLILESLGRIFVFSSFIFNWLWTGCGYSVRTGSISKVPELPKVIWISWGLVSWSSIII